MKRFKVTINDRVFEVEVEEMGSETPEKSISQLEEKVEEKVEKKVEENNSLKSVSEDLEGEKILAPLPGTISLEVKVGDIVSKGDTLFILEAMKMENEISSTISGKVSAIYVSNGDSVDTGDLLAIIG